MQVMKSVNRSIVLDLIQHQGPISQAEISRRTGLSRTTVSSLVRMLREEELVKQTGKGTSPIGRKPDLLVFNGDAGYVVGVDLGGTNIVGAVANLTGAILHKATTPVRKGEGRWMDFRDLVAFIQSLVFRAEVDWHSIRTVAVGAPGITHPDGFVIWAPALGWRNFPLGQMLAEELRARVIVENDVNMIALGEYWFGAGRGSRSLACIAVGTGIGAGIVLDGMLYRGAHHAAGEVGYIVVGEEYLGQDFRDFGCLESLASGPGIARLAADLVRKGVPSRLPEISPDLSGITAEMVFAAAREGDQVAVQVIEKVTRYLAMCVANVSVILNPDLIILGGGVMRSGDMLLEPIRRFVEPVVPHMPMLLCSTLKEDAGVYGAVALALHTSMERVVLEVKK